MNARHGFFSKLIKTLIFCKFLPQNKLFHLADKVLNICDPTPQNEALLEKLRSALRAEM